MEFFGLHVLRRAIVGQKQELSLELPDRSIAALTWRSSPSAGPTSAGLESCV